MQRVTIGSWAASGVGPRSRDPQKTLVSIRFLVQLGGVGMRCRRGLGASREGQLSVGRDRESSRDARRVVLWLALTLLVFALSAARADAATVPLIVDTDMFSDADDAGALATAFGLQYRGEAHVIAVAVNTRTSRPAVATNSWKCVAAITSFYGSSTVPIGTAMPNNGSSSGDG